MKNIRLRDRLTKLCSRVWLVGVYFPTEKTRCRSHGKEQLALILLCSIAVCWTGCSDSGSTSEEIPEPPAPTQDDLGDASGSPDDMFLEDSESEGSSITE